MYATLVLIAGTLNSSSRSQNWWWLRNTEDSGDHFDQVDDDEE